MTFVAEELRLKSNTPEKQIEEIRRWSAKLVENMNYQLNHLDSTNFTKDLEPSIAGKEIPSLVKKAMDDQYKELRTLTIARTKGKTSNTEGFAVLGDIKICWGIVEITPEAENVAACEWITFPVPYTVNPNIQTTFENSDPGARVIGCSYDDLTTAGCNIYVTRTNTTATKVSWLAIGK